MCRALCLGVVMAGVTGCETLRSRLRQDDDDKKHARADLDDATKPKAIESDTSKINSVDSDASDPKPFFKSDRRSGGCRLEPRDIGSHFGIN